MRQMDTILVAVGVPTREVPGTSFALPQPVTVTKGTEEMPDQTPREQQEAEILNQTEVGGTGTEETGGMMDATGDGWDIPDISDLLDSLSDPESASQPGVRNNLPLTAKDKTTDSETSFVLNAPCDTVEEGNTDNKHISWDDTQ